MSLDDRKEVSGLNLGRLFHHLSQALGAGDVTAKNVAADERVEYRPVYLFTFAALFSLTDGGSGKKRRRWEEERALVKLETYVNGSLREQKLS